jgi:hypothetical protein
MEAASLFPGDGTTRTGEGRETNFLDILKIFDKVFA